MRRGLKIINGLRRKQPGHYKFFCFHCLKSGKGNPCGINGHRIKMIAHKIHFPSPKASKYRWREFIKKVQLDRWGIFCEQENWDLLLKSIEKVCK